MLSHKDVRWATCLTFYTSITSLSSSNQYLIPTYFYYCTVHSRYRQILKLYHPIWFCIGNYECYISLSCSNQSLSSHSQFRLVCRYLRDTTLTPHHKSPLDHTQNPQAYDRGMIWVLQYMYLNHSMTLQTRQYNSYKRTQRTKKTDQCHTKCSNTKLSKFILDFLNQISQKDQIPEMFEWIHSSMILYAVVDSVCNAFYNECIWLIMLLWRWYEHQSRIISTHSGCRIM